MTQEEQSAAQVSFEEALHTLNQVVATLEQGELPLDQAIECYEKGAAMAALCEQKLKAAELRVRQWQEEEA